MRLKGRAMTDAEPSIVTLIKTGWLTGHPILRAGEAFQCESYRGRLAGGFCRKPIEVGDLYVEGVFKGYAVPNGVALHQRYCPECAGEEALAAIAEAGR